MAKGISPLDAMHSIMMRLSLIIMWLAFAAFHLALAVLALAAAWLWQIAPSDVAAWGTSAFRRAHGATLVAVAGSLGVSAAAALYWYRKLWRRLYSAVVTPYLFRDIEEALKE